MWQSFRVDQTPSNAIDGITSSKKHAVIHFINVSHVRSPKPFDLINIFKSLLFAEKSFYRYCSIWIWFLSWNIYDSIALLFTGNFILFHIVLCSIRFVLLSSGVPHFLTSFEVVINLCTAPVILAISDSIQSCSYSHFSHGAHYNLKLSQNVTMRSKQNFSSAGKHKKKRNEKLHNRSCLAVMVHNQSGNIVGGNCNTNCSAAGPFLFAEFGWHPATCHATTSWKAASHQASGNEPSSHPAIQAANKCLAFCFQCN